MSNVINGYAFSSSVILSEAKDLTPVLASHMVPCVTVGSIVRFLRYARNDRAAAHRRHES
jgi:hypothetical protein